MTDMNDKMEKARIEHLHKYWPEDEKEKARIAGWRKAYEARQLRLAKREAKRDDS